MIHSYEIVEIAERHLIGSTKSISEETPDMSFWGAFYRSYYHLIPQRVNEKVYEVYTPLPTEKTGYQVAIACESHYMLPLPAELTAVTIPAGAYAKFTITGEVHEVVPQFWKDLANQQLPFTRSYHCDFEEFPNNETEDVTITIYLSIH